MINNKKKEKGPRVAGGDYLCSDQRFSIISAYVSRGSHHLNKPASSKIGGLLPPVGDKD